MTHAHSQRSTLLVLMLLLFLAAVACAGTVDPLLVGLQTQRAGKSGPGLTDFTYARLIAIEDGGRYDDPTIGVIIDLVGGLPDLSHVRSLIVGSVSNRIATGRLPLSSLADLTATEGIVHVQASHLMQPFMDIAIPEGNVDDVWAGAPAYTGDGVIVGVIDSGIDWRREDFGTPGGGTRILAIWDLHGTGTPPAGFSYGAEYTSAQINDGTAGERDLSGHGTHVSGIAAGNGQSSGGLYRGVAYESDIIFAKPFNDAAGGFPEDKTIDAMNYLAQKASSLGKPIAINMSLGGHFGSHDGTSPQERLIDSLSGTGVAFFVAAGNEGDSFVHDQTSGSSGSLLYRILPYNANPGANNDFASMMIWVDGSSSPSVTVQGSGMTVGPIASGTVDGLGGTGGVVVIDNASGGVDPQNGDKLIVVFFDDREGTPPAATDWTISLSGGSGTAHAWQVGGTMTAGFPGSDNRYSVAMPAGAESAITVVAHKTRNTWPSLTGTGSYQGHWADALIGDRAPFSAIGPTRDGRQKPDISAPGMAILSVYSQDTTPPADNSLIVPGSAYYSTQGTSMSSPFVCGVAALMLEKDPTLTAAAIKTILQETAIQDSFTGATWNESFGAGKVDALAAITAVSGGGGGDPDGDIDSDGRATVLDLVMLVNHILDPSGHPLAGSARSAADVYPAPAGNGLLDAQDLARIVAFVLGTDTPGLVSGAPPAVVAVAAPQQAAGQAWLPIHVSGASVAAGQFVLRVDGANWPAGDLVVDHDAGVPVTARVVGDQLRLIFFTMSGELPAGGFEMRIPVGPEAAALGTPNVSGVLLAAPGGAARKTQVEMASFASLALGVAPNPSSGPTTISYRLGRAPATELAVFDLRGRRVRMLNHDGAADSASQLAWDGCDDQGRALPAGVYMVRLTTPQETIARKVTMRR